MSSIYISQNTLKVKELNGFLHICDPRLYNIKHTAFSWFKHIFVRYRVHRKGLGAAYSLTLSSPAFSYVFSQNTYQCTYKVSKLHKLDKYCVALSKNTVYAFIVLSFSLTIFKVQFILQKNVLF